MGTRIVIVDRLFDGHQVREVGERAAVAVSDGVIDAIGPADELTENHPDADVDDYRGTTLLPGLIDCHVHSTLPGDGTPPDEAAARGVEQRHETARGNLGAHLATGVTTVRDLGSHEDYLGFVPDPAQSPRLLRVGPPLTAAKGHMHFFGGANAAADGAVTRMNRSFG
ncbi:imidazolonepropionase-like domain-containing protein, partial [Mycobacterium sp. NPDC003449]